MFGQGYPGSVRGIPIQKYEDPNYESMVPILNLQSPRAVDFYAAEDYVYYADSTNYTIGRQKLNGTLREDLLSDCKLAFFASYLDKLNPHSWNTYVLVYFVVETIACYV